MARFLLGSDDDWRMGHTKIFLRDAASALLEERYKVFKLSCKLLLQARPTPRPKQCTTPRSNLLLREPLAGRDPR